MLFPIAVLLWLLLLPIALLGYIGMRLGRTLTRMWNGPRQPLSRRRYVDYR
jgi:hypothetical protein